MGTNNVIDSDKHCIHCGNGLKQHQVHHELYYCMMCEAVWLDIRGVWHHLSKEDVAAFIAENGGK